MPMFEFKCADCNLRREHFVYPGAPLEKICSVCGSKNYQRQFSRFKATIEYADSSEHFEKVINPGVNEIYDRIGREALNEDANTLENVFGTESVKSTIAEKDD